MNIIFSPEYSGTVFVKSADGKDVMMDTVVMNTIGLINMLELRLGLHYEEISAQERLTHYYEAVCKYMADHPTDVMAASFNTAGLSTAKSMLAWRDELRGAEWDFDGEEISKRLAAIIGVEKFFKKSADCDMAARLHIVTDQLCSQQLDCRNMVITLPVAKELLKPAVKALIDALETQGARTKQQESAVDDNNNLAKVRQLIASKQKGKITLDKNDTSIQIWKFPDNRLACEYLSYSMMEDVDVWINADNKQMDNWLRLMNKSVTGSVAADCTPHLTQLFVMGLGLYSHPLNVNTLVEWLNMPIHPIDDFFRTILADTIVQNGGYRNGACRKVVEQFISGSYVYLDAEQKKLPEEEQEKLRRKDRKKREKLVATFLPSLSSSPTISTDEVRRFVTELSSWCCQRAHLMADDAAKELWIEQLMAVSAMCNAFHILLQTVADDTIPFKTIDSWMSTIYEKASYTNAVAEQGCRTVLDSPSKIASVAECCVWIGVDGDAGVPQECAFLYPSEKAGLKEMRNFHPWAEELQNSYHEQMLMTPLRMTSRRLILVVRERMGGETTLKHPLIVRLEQQIENINDFIFYPRIGVEERHRVEVVKNADTTPELEFSHADKLQWPDHLSPTIIGTLVEHPFDYMMEHLLGITYDGKARMSDVRTAKGNVAHAVIEKLFAPRNGKRHAIPEEIENRIRDEYEAIYGNVLEAKGAVLQLAENKLAEKLLREQLRNCLDTLLEILKENGLKVTACEQPVECMMNLGLPVATDDDGTVKERDMTGSIDMTLEDRDGHPVVFDFKWSSWSGYQGKLKENRSVQLELYRMMLGLKKKDDVRRVAYFLMPEARLYSQEAFLGRHCQQIPSDNQDNIVDQLRQSAMYRRRQIDDGRVETNGTYEELQYVQDTLDAGLFPLKKSREGRKEENIFSQYKLFNS